LDVEKRLLEDATSFAKEVASLDEEGIISRTLAVLGIPPKDTDMITDTDEATPEAGRTQRPAPAGGPASGQLAKNSRHK